MIGLEGVVCGVDVDSEALEELRAQAARASLSNIRVKQAAAEEVFLCERSADMVFIGIALDDFKIRSGYYRTSMGSSRPKVGWSI